MDEIGVFIIDGHQMIRSGLEMLLGSMPGITVVGTSDIAAPLWRELEDHRVQVVLVDLRIRGETPSFEVIRRVHDQYPSARVIIMIESMQSEVVIAAVQAGADGLIMKDATATQIEHIVRTVALSYQVFHPEVVAAIVTALQEKPEELPLLDGIPYLPMLTMRENEVLRLLATGLSNQAIADQLIITEATVKTHLNNIYSKLKISDRLQAVFYAMRVGLAPPIQPLESDLSDVRSGA